MREGQKCTNKAHPFAIAADLDVLSTVVMLRGRYIDATSPLAQLWLCAESPWVTAKLASVQGGETDALAQA